MSKSYWNTATNIPFSNTLESLGGDQNKHEEKSTSTHCRKQVPPQKGIIFLLQQLQKIPHALKKFPPWENQTTKLTKQDKESR